LIAIAICCLSLKAVAAAIRSDADQHLEHAYQAMLDGEAAVALSLWQQAAEQGSVTAMLNLGQVYRLGQGVDQDDEAAVGWYVRAAQQGSQVAQYNLLLMEREGRAQDTDLRAAYAQSTASGSSIALAATSPNRSVPEASPATPPVATETVKEDPSARWLVSLKDDALLLQMMAMYEKGPIEALVAAELNEGEATYSRIVQVMRQNEHLYVLVAGPFDTIGAAEQFRDGLPDAFKEARPWVMRAARMKRDLLSETLTGPR